MVELTIDGGSVSSRAELYESICDGLGLPQGRVENLDALCDELCSLPDGCRVCLADADGLRFALGDYFDRLLAALQDMSARNPGIELELSGWDNEL